MCIIIALADIVLGIAGLVLAAIFPTILGAATIVGALAALISGIGFLVIEQQHHRYHD